MNTTENSHDWKTRICICVCVCVVGGVVLNLCAFKWLWVQPGTTAFIRKSHLAGHACHFLFCRLFHMIRDIWLDYGTIVFHWYYPGLCGSLATSCVNHRPFDDNDDDPSVLLFFMGHKRKVSHSTQISTHHNQCMRNFSTGMRAVHISQETDLHWFRRKYHTSAVLPSPGWAKTQEPVAMIASLLTESSSVMYRYSHNTTSSYTQHWKEKHYFCSVAFL